MDTSTTETADVKPQDDVGEGGADSLTVPKAEYDKLNQTLGSLKRELKDLRKSSEEKETPKQTKTEDNALLQRLERMAMQQQGITHQEDIELARNTAKKWHMEIEDVLADPDFKVKLERQQTARSNADATSNIRGSGNSSQAKNTPEYWTALGRYPTAQEVPDKKARAKVAHAFMKNARTSGKTFYND